MSVKDNLQRIQQKIADAQRRAGRPEHSVRLMAVSKFHPEAAVREAIQAGQLLFGENRVQEAAQKFPGILAETGAELHIIGSLQSNKVKGAVKIASCIQSVDRLSLIEEIEKQCEKLGRSVSILFEFHTGEESKAGFRTQEEVEAALELFSAGRFPHVTPKGFMTMAPLTDDRQLIRDSFVRLRRLSESLQEKYPSLRLDELSMGMSADFEIAIEEGSTLVRIGTAIFGEREQH